MDLTRDFIGIVSVEREASLNQVLTQNESTITNSINDLSISIRGGGNIGEGIRIAQQELEANCSDDVLPVILLFTDGTPTSHSPEGAFCEVNCPTTNNTCTDYARTQANYAKENDTIIFSLGFTGGILVVKTIIIMNQL